MFYDFSHNWSFIRETESILDNINVCVEETSHSICCIVLVLQLNYVQLDSVSPVFRHTCPSLSLSVCAGEGVVSEPPDEAQASEVGGRVSWSSAEEEGQSACEPLESRHTAAGRRGRGRHQRWLDCSTHTHLTHTSHTSHTLRNTPSHGFESPVSRQKHDQGLINAKAEVALPLVIDHKKSKV